MRNAFVGSNVLAIARRELRAAFDLPIAYVTIAAFLALSALGGLLGFFDRGAADLRDYFTGLRFAFVLFAPAIAMRLWAEERRQGTFELLFTLPVAPWEAVLGKFLGALGLVAVTLALGAALPLSLVPVAPFDPGAVVAGYLGAFLLAAVELALGLFVSSLTENQIVAFTAAAAASFFLLIAGEPSLLREAEQANVPESLVWVRDVLVSGLGRIGTGAHQESLARGVLDTRDLVYFVAFSGLFLFANTIAVERRRPFGRIEAALALVLAASVALLAEDLATRRHARADLTTRRTFSLGEGTRKVLDSLDARLTLRCYLSSDLPTNDEKPRRALLDFLEEVEASGHGNVKLEVLDPSHDEKIAAQAEREGLTKITRQSKSSESFEQRKIYGGITLLYAGKPPVVMPLALYLSNLEYDFAVLVRKLTRTEPYRIALVEARDGRQPSDKKRVREELARSYTVEDLDLARKGQVPKDYQTVLLYADAPERAVLDDRSLYALDQFVCRGGSLVVFAQTVEADMKTWKAKPVAPYPLLEQLASYGLEVGNGLVLAPSSRAFLFQTPPRGFVQSPYPAFLKVDGRSSEGSPIAGQLLDSLVPFVAEVRVRPSLAPGVAPSVLASSYPGWTLEGRGECAIEPTTLPKYAEGLGPKVPHAVAAAVQGEIPSAWAGRPVPPPPAPTRPEDDPLKAPLAKSQGGKVVVFGCVDVSRDFWIEQSQGNGLLVQNAVDWASQDASLVALRARNSPPALEANQEKLDRAKARAWAINLVGLPSLVLVAGVLRFLVRRRSGRAAASLSRAG